MALLIPNYVKETSSLVRKVYVSCKLLGKQSVCLHFQLHCFTRYFTTTKWNPNHFQPKAHSEYIGGLTWNLYLLLLCFRPSKPSSDLKGGGEVTQNPKQRSSLKFIRDHFPMNLGIQDLLVTFLSYPDGMFEQHCGRSLIACLRYSGRRNGEMDNIWPAELWEVSGWSI
jgi:hypothetical protein